MSTLATQPTPKPVIAPFVAVLIKDFEPYNFMVGAVRGADHADAAAKADEHVRRYLGEECGHLHDDVLPPSAEELAKHGLGYRIWMTEYGEFAEVLETIDNLEKGLGGA